MKCNERAYDDDGGGGGGGVVVDGGGGGVGGSGGGGGGGSVCGEEGIRLWYLLQECRQKRHMSFRIHITSTLNVFRRQAPLLPKYTLSSSSSRYCFTQPIELTRYLPEHWYSRLTPKNSHAITPPSERASKCCLVMKERTLLSTLHELANNFQHSGSLQFSHLFYVRRT